MSTQELNFLPLEELPEEVLLQVSGGTGALFVVPLVTEAMQNLGIVQSDQGNS